MRLSKYEKKKVRAMSNAEAIAYIGELVVEERLRAWRYWGLKAVKDRDTDSVTKSTTYEQPEAKHGQS